MNNHVRKKVYEWLLKITSNSTKFGHQRNEKSQINLSINEQIELTTNMDMQSDATPFFHKINLSHYNITPENFNSFLEILNISKLHHPVAKNKVESCVEYCSGSFHDALIGYKSFHGYVSLVVSTNLLN